MTAQSATELFPDVDLIDADPADLGYCVGHLSVFDHWLTAEEAESCKVFAYDAAVKAGAMNEYTEGEHRFLTLYLAMAQDGVRCHQPLRGETLFPGDPRLVPLLVDSLRERCLMDVYFQGAQVRVMGRYDRTDMVLATSPQQLNQVRAISHGSGLHLLE